MIAMIKRRCDKLLVMLIQQCRLDVHVVWCGVASPGHSVSVFIHLSTLVIAGSVLVRGVNTAWASDVVFSRLCQVPLLRCLTD